LTKGDIIISRIKNKTDLDIENIKGQPQTQTKASSSSLLGGFGSSFLGYLTGAMAGMGLYHLLFDHSVTPESLGQSLGMN
jgi:hypothetical protein